MNNLDELKRAIKFYEQSPTGQYDDIAVEALKKMLTPSQPDSGELLPMPNDYLQGVADVLGYILDNGEALPEEHLQQILAHFYRNENTRLSTQDGWISEEACLRVTPHTHKAFGKYKYQVIDRQGEVCHNTNNIYDAESYMIKLNDYYITTPNPPKGGK